MAFPSFTHIHCSSRFDRSAESLEADLDDWMEKCSLITLTEIKTNNRAARMHEKGWGYFNAKQGNGADECGIAWRTDLWRAKHRVARKLTDIRAGRPLFPGHSFAPTHAASVVLRRVNTSHTLLVSVAHFPVFVEDSANNAFRDATEAQQVRKRAYLSALQGWNTHTDQLERKYKTDATLIIADWNLNLKEHWVRDLLYDRFGKEYRQAWTRFPTAGGSLHGGPVVPLGAPGQTQGDRIIDGTLYRGLKVETHPNLMARVRSSDHRPYKESFEYLAKPGVRTGGLEHEDASGDTKPGKPWWGFGDYAGDEIYALNFTKTGDEGGEVL